jgi:subtilisin family serine protease
MRGLEPPRGFPHTDLNRARLPIPPHPRGAAIVAPAQPPTFSPSERTIWYLRRLFLVGVCLVAALPALAAARGPAPAPGRLAEVVVELQGPGLATSVDHRGRLKLDGTAARRQLDRIADEQELVEQRIRAAVPSAKVRWRYRVVLNALAVLVPQQNVRRLESVPGVRGVQKSLQYRPALDRSVPAIHAPALWGAGLATSGQGMKIGIIDDGVDQRHPFFDPKGFAMPAGYPKGQATFTTAKVIVARVFQPPSPRPRYSNLPFDPEHSEHGTHVAGIAAGNSGTQANVGGGRVTLSGVAPNAYIGNYRVLTVPTVSNVGLDGNSPEIAAGIEMAVRDGMDVINLSLGEPEISPGRDIVVRAIEGAAAAGVVPVVAAGNEFGSFGRGSVSSPGSAASAITAGASTVAGRMADFSSAGPTPLSLRLKPEVTAPGVGILSSVPAREGTWASFSGTSMAAPHIAGAAALLAQRHSTWTVAQIKSALSLTAHRAFEGGSREASTTREGAGFVDLAEADQPLVFARPSAVSFGFLRPGRAATRRVSLTDAGGGAGVWTAAVERQGASPGLSISVPPQQTVPGTLAIRASAARSARQGDVTGFVVLSAAGKTRRVPFWLRVSAPRLSRQPARPLRRPGVYHGSTRGRKALVSIYRYPEDPSGVGVDRVLAGPEQVFRVRLRRPAANFGVALTSRSAVQPRIVVGGDENRQAGPTALPLNVNPYLPTFLDPAPVSAVISPTPGTYDVVFDSRTRAGAGPFTFRFWVGDASPPSLRLLTPSARSGGTLVASAKDSGAGVDPRAVFATVDGTARPAVFSGGRIRISLRSLSPGRHRLVLQVSDHQESKNMENVARILPNTAVLTASFRVG